MSSSKVLLTAALLVLLFVIMLYSLGFFKAVALMAFVGASVVAVRRIAK